MRDEHAAIAGAGGFCRPSTVGKIRPYVGIRPYVVAAAVILLVGAPAWAGPFRTVVNKRFASVCNGPQGAILRALPLNGRVAPAAVGRVVAEQHPTATLQRALSGLRAMVARGLKSPAALKAACFPRMMYDTLGGRLVLPHLVRAAATGTGLGNPANQLTFTFSGWSTADQAELQTYLTNAYPKMRMVYGPPAFNATISIIQDSTITSYEGGVFDASTNEIHMAPLTDNYGESTFTLCLLVLHAFRGDTALYYDAWEDGMAGAAATVVQTLPGVAPGYDPTAGSFYMWQIYECENQPALGNNTFYPASGWDAMLVWRICMARTVWLKAWDEDNNFFSNFNQAYYAAYTTTLPGDVPGLKDVAATVLPSVEGMNFYDWFMQQYVLDTSVSQGPKLFTWNLPDVDGVDLWAEHYFTDPTGNETALTGTPQLIFWSYNLSTDLYSEEGDTLPPSPTWSGESIGLGSFTNVGGAQCVTVEVDVNGLRGMYPYPYDVRGLDPGENNFWGCIMGGPTATINVSGSYVRSSIPATQGVFGTILGTGPRLVPGKISVLVTNPLGQKVTRAINVGWDGYTAFLPGGGQAALTNTFTFAGNGYQLISFPVTPTQSYAPTLLGIPASSLLLARWNPSAPPAGVYQIWPQIDPFAPGRGYWLRLYGTVTVKVQGLLPDETQSFPLEVPLGWNMVGSPRQYVVNVADLTVQAGTQTPVSVAVAVSQGLLQQGFYAYNPASNSYSLATTLAPFQGYWVRCLVPGGVRVVFPPKG